jgi:hypothetical protein
MENEESESFKAIVELVKGQEQLGKQAYAIYKPEVEAIIKSNLKDVKKIELTLDYMLSFCFNDDMLLLYRRLCRHLYYINEESAAFYVNAFIEMWDEEKTKFWNKNSIKD